MRYAAEGLEHAHALGGHGLERRHLAVGIERGVQFLHRVHVGQIALVELHRPGNLIQAQAVLGQVRAQVGETLPVLVHLADFTVGHEHDRVGALEHQLAGGVVEHLAGHGVEQEAGLEPHDLAEIEGKQVEEQRPVGLRLHAHHLAAALLGHGLEDGLEIGRLTAQPGAVVHELGVDLFA